MMKKFLSKKCDGLRVNLVYVSEGTFPKGGKDMTDEKIIELFWSRDENAIKETEKKYGDLCHFVMSGILPVKEDREECINDAMLVLWNTIPPEKPASFSAYLAKILRTIALERTRRENLETRRTRAHGRGGIFARHNRRQNSCG